VVVLYEDGAASAKEVRRRAGNRDLAQVFMLSRTSERLASAQPIFERR
jgi:hypothetical protein